VIAGYVPSSVSKDLVGSLVLGYHTPDPWADFRASAAPLPTGTH
jgi:hypothetical protein